jgi:catalase
MDPNGSKRYGLASLTSRKGVAGATLIAVAVVAVGGAFAYTGGWLSPGRLTQERIIDRFQQVDGPHPGFRRNHAKGLCATGDFDSNGAVQSLSDAAVFRPGRTAVFGRFAFAGGQPYMADDVHTVRSLAVDFERDGEVWRTGMIDIPVFPVRDVRGFYEQLTASKPDPATGKPDPARMAAFLAAHPETQRALTIIKAQPPTSGFADATYNGLNAFRFVSAAGRSTPVRWSLVPEDPVREPQANSARPTDRNYLFDDLIARVGQGPLRYRLVVTVGDPGDPTNDANTPWPAGRRRVEAGVLTITGVQDEAHGACRDVTFDPLILPHGIASSDDPLLSARSAAYSTGFTRRAGEPAPVPPPVTIPAASQGAN